LKKTGKKYSSNAQKFELDFSFRLAYHIHTGKRKNPDTITITKEDIIMTTRKTVYTPEVTARLVAEYTGAETQEAREAVVEAFAQELEVKVASVRAKLVREEVYIAKVRETKRSATKAEMVAEIAARIGKSAEALESLEKATATSLKALLKALPEA
jgi:hypothetical protein